VHDFQIITSLREDVNPSDMDQIRLANNKDVAVDLFCQVGAYEGASGIMHVDVVEADGDIDLSENLDRVYEAGTPVIFRSATQGKWSTEYDTPDTYATSTSFSEVGSTGLYLKFTAGPEAYIFAVGDRITIHNPGLELRKSRTKKFMAEDSESIGAFGLREYNIDNPYMRPTLGNPSTQGIVDNESGPHRLFVIECPLFLQARPLMLVTLKSRKLLPLASSNEEKCYIKQVTHKGLRKGGSPRTTIIMRGVSAYA